MKNYLILCALICTLCACKKDNSTPPDNPKEEGAPTATQDYRERYKGRFAISKTAVFVNHRSGFPQEDTTIITKSIDTITVDYDIKDTIEVYIRGYWDTSQPSLSVTYASDGTLVYWGIDTLGNIAPLSSRNDGDYIGGFISENVLDYSRRDWRSNTTHRDTVKGIRIK